MRWILNNKYTVCRIRTHFFTFQKGIIRFTIYRTLIYIFIHKFKPIYVALFMFCVQNIITRFCLCVIYLFRKIFDYTEYIVSKIRYNNIDMHR